ncbi:MAG: flagellar assembly protein FliW [Nitrospirae bacterium]|nr:flagellar assembly protein FliW [Nitrospirota bacterium]
MTQNGMLTVETSRFGAIEVHGDTVLTFPNGLVGMEQLKGFVLIEGAGPFQWMQSLDDPDACFVVIDSEEVIGDYVVTPAAEDLAVVTGDAPGAALIALLIVTVPRDESAPLTANLLAPLLVNLGNRSGVQAVLTDRHPVRHPIMVRNQTLASTG